MSQANTFIPNSVFEFLDAKHYILDGVSGVFHHRIWTARYPYLHKREELAHEADDEGLCSEAYRKTKRELGDDWSSDLTNAIDLYCDIAAKLGYTEEP